MTIPHNSTRPVKDSALLVQCQEMSALLWVVLLQNTPTVLNHNLRGEEKEGGQKWGGGGGMTEMGGGGGGGTEMGKRVRKEGIKQCTIHVADLENK